jgi:hypothetical protein
MRNSRVTPKPKAVNIFIIAEQFRLASKLATLAPLMVDRYPEFEFVRNNHMLTASMVCAAFSLELYFKCLIRIGHKAYELDHNLERLFQLVGRRSRTQIKRYFYENDHQVRGYVERQYQGSGRQIPIADLFGFCLAASSRAFVQMRYVFERGIPPDEGWLGDAIVECARRVILGQRPN